jgi:hypothetical protein
MQAKGGIDPNFTTTKELLPPSNKLQIGKITVETISISNIELADEWRSGNLIE